MNQVCPSALASFLLFVGVGASVATPYFIMRAVDEGLERQSFEAALCWSALGSACLLISGILQYLARVRLHRDGLELERRERLDLFTHIAGARLESLCDIGAEVWSGRLINAASSLRAWQTALATGVIPFVVTLLGCAALLLSLSWQLALLSAAIVPAGLAVFVFLRRRLHASSNAHLGAGEALYAALVEAFSALVPIRALQKQGWITDKFAAACAACSQSAYNHYRNAAVQAPVFDAAQALVTVIVFGAGGWLLAHAMTSVGVIVAFQVCIAKMFSVVRSISNVGVAYIDYREGRRRAAQIRGIAAAEQASFLEATSPVILRICGLYFSFGDHVIWKDYHLELHEGDRACVLSHSGSGKTTLARLILGLYIPSAGTIALPNASPSSVGYVPQENYLVSGTLRDNVEFLSGPIADEKYNTLLEICGLEEIRERFGATPVGHNGQMLSGGEQRRVMLARAIATEPGLLIIDQMTSELEPSLCDRIFTNLERHYPKLAILYLGHRSPFSEHLAADGTCKNNPVDAVCDESG